MGRNEVKRVICQKINFLASVKYAENRKKWQKILFVNYLRIKEDKINS